MSTPLKTKHEQLQDKNRQCIDRTLQKIKTIVDDPKTFKKLLKKTETGVRYSVIYEEDNSDVSWFGSLWYSPKEDESCFWKNRENQEYIKEQLTDIFEEAGYGDNYEMTWSRYIEDSSSGHGPYWIPGHLSVQW